MTLRKHGAGEIMPEEDDQSKTAAANWTEDDRAALAQENTEADRESE